MDVDGPPTPSLAHSAHHAHIPALDRRARMPTLPAELVLAIIRLALPPLRKETFTERYSILRACQLVSRAWAPLAQAELYRHVHLPTLDTIAAFPPPFLPHPAYLTQSNDRFRRTRTMRLGKRQPAPRWRDAGDHALPTVPNLWGALRHCTVLEELSITGLDIPDYAELSVVAGALPGLPGVPGRSREGTQLT